NRVLYGWFGYFKLAQSRTFIDLDKLIRRRLRALLRKQEKRPGIGRTVSVPSRLRLGWIACIARTCEAYCPYDCT
ncbi:MAG TPA: group II intron maturase-specific domain-containing protein, partial [Geminicoccaceae bacterium]|nr:group II intron maturase-specific domain-containing protein [Geminicoccaceae bacterium]